MDLAARLTTLTRIGFAARGLLYLVIGVLVVSAGRAEDPSGALAYLAQGGGRLLLGLIAAGLLAYGVWRLADAALDVERRGHSGKALAERVAAAVSGIVHLVLAWQAIRLMQGGGSAGQDGAQQGAETALSLPGGGWLLIGAALVLAGVGVFQLVKAAKGDFLKHLEPQVARQPWARWTGRAGYAARGLVFVIIAFFLFRAGSEEQSSEAGGMAQALAWLDSPWDVLIAIGLFGFGLFSLIEARYRILHDVQVPRHG